MVNYSDGCRCSYTPWESVVVGQWSRDQKFWGSIPDPGYSLDKLGTFCELLESHTLALCVIARNDCVRVHIKIQMCRKYTTTVMQQLLILAHKHDIKLPVIERVVTSYHIHCYRWLYYVIFIVVLLFLPLWPLFMNENGGLYFTRTPSLLDVITLSVAIVCLL